MRRLYSLAFLLSTPLCQAAIEDESKVLFTMGLSELMRLTVTSVTKTEASLAESSAAVSVIDSELIKASGLRSIPELLRLAPGVQVAKINKSNWAISIRGLNGLYAGSLLVMVDSRPVYTPLFSGVYWDALNMPVETIERIEVIRGPGGALWGANAVNGVINIISKRENTNAKSITAIGGDVDSEAVVRFSSTSEDGASYNAYARIHETEAGRDVTGGRSNDDWRGVRLGGHASWANGMSLQSEFYKLDKQISVPLAMLTPPFARIGTQQDSQGGFLQFQWDNEEASNPWSLNTYYSLDERQEDSFDQKLYTFDIEYQQTITPGDKHEILYGLGYRRVEDDLAGSFTVSFTPKETSYSQYNLFVQDQFQLNDKLRLTSGIKLESSPKTEGIAVQPSLRLLYQPGDKTTFWAAASRALRTRSRAEDSITINAAVFPLFLDPDGPGPAPVGQQLGVIQVNGTNNLEPEELRALELGFRTSIKGNLFLDISIFKNFYRDLISSIATNPTFVGGPVPYIALAQRFDNNDKVTSYGVETDIRWQVNEKLQLLGSFSWSEMTASGRDPAEAGRLEGALPQLMYRLGVQYAVTPAVTFNSNYYYTDELEQLQGDTGVDAFHRLDLVINWRISPKFELSLVSQGLIDDNHLEYIDGSMFSTRSPRSTYARLSVEF